MAGANSTDLRGRVLAAVEAGCHPRAPAANDRLASNSAVRPTNSEGLLVLGWAAKSCPSAYGRTTP